MNGSTTVIDALAAYRLTRLVTKDVLLDELRNGVVAWAYFRQVDNLRNADGPQRERATIPQGLSFAEFAQHDPDAPKLATLITCRWCAGMWISLGVVAARRVAPGLWGPLAKALALSAGAALISRLETD